MVFIIDHILKQILPDIEKHAKEMVHNLWEIVVKLIVFTWYIEKSWNGSLILLLYKSMFNLFGRALQWIKV